MNNRLGKKISMTLLVIVCICCNFSTAAFAKENYKSHISEQSTISIQDQKIQPRTDVIEIKYRFINGILQYRQWNKTRNYWVDPYWIVC